MILKYLFILSLVLQINYNNLYIANIFYLIILLQQIIINKFVLRNNQLMVIASFAFVSWTIFVTLFFNIAAGIQITSRNLIQLFFNLQYLIFLFPLCWNKYKYEKIFKNISLLYACYIISIFIFEGYYNNLSAFYINREWLDPYIFVNSTSVFLPLLLGLYYEYKESVSLNIVKFIFYLALLLTTARGALLGGILVFLYFEIIRGRFVRKKVFLLSSVILLSIIAVLYVPSFYDRLVVFSDRAGIMNVSMEYISFHPLSGMGGNTLEQLKEIEIFKIKAKSIIPLSHTHNWVLEILLRYGLIGLSLFFIMLFVVYRNIKNESDKFIFIVLLTLALFQTYIRDFVFVCYLSTLLPMKKYNIWSKFKN